MRTEEEVDDNYVMTEEEMDRDYWDWHINCPPMVRAEVSVIMKLSCLKEVKSEDLGMLMLITNEVKARN